MPGPNRRHEDEQHGVINIKLDNIVNTLEVMVADWKEDKKEQRSILDTHSANISFFRGVLYIVLPIIVGVVGYIINDVITN